MTDDLLTRKVRIALSWDDTPRCDALLVNTTYAFVTCHTLYFWEFQTPPKTYRGPF